MSTIEQLQFEPVSKGLNEASKTIFANNKEKGFWKGERSFGEILCLVHSEVSEALEGLRNDKRAPFNQENMIPDSMTKEEFLEKIKDTFEDEIADVIIRTLDLCGALGIDIDGHINAKIAYNKSRPFKHGKQF